MAKDFLKAFGDKTRNSGLVKSMYERSLYCMNVIDNIFPDNMDVKYEKMFLNGSGNELTGKACAVHSSSMFAFNFYHWISEETPLVLDKHKYTKVYFEVQLPTLVGSTPANMDVVLEETHPNGKRTLLFIESKFTEHFKNANSDMLKMSTNSYSVESRRSYKYYPYNCTNILKWRQLIAEFAERSKSRSGYYDGIKQEICHLIALSNLKNDKTAREDYDKNYKRSDVIHPIITGDEEFLFYNVLFDACFDFSESNRFSEYEKLYNDFKSYIEKLGLDKGIRSSIHSYREIFDAIPESRSKEKEYLQNRYMRFSKKEHNNTQRSLQQS